jgi:hypothetical protein
VNDAGVVRVYLEDAQGGSDLVGEDNIAPTATDEALSLALGTAFDIVGQRLQTQFRQIAERTVEETTAITLTNRLQRDVIVRATERLFRASDAQVANSSQPYRQIDAHTIEFNISAPAGKQASVKYTTRYIC